MRSYQIIDFGRPLKEVELADPSPPGMRSSSPSRRRASATPICTSGKAATISGTARNSMLKDRGIPLPLTMGHETAGEIIAVGAKVEDRKVGEMVLVYPWIGCGVCRVCRDGNENLCMKPRWLGVHCDGGYSDEIVVPHSSDICLPLDGLDPVVAAPFACSGVTTYSALKKFGPLIKDEPVLVLGAGGLGLMCVSILKAMGGKGAVVVDIDEIAPKRGALRPARSRQSTGRRRMPLAQVHSGARRPLLGRRSISSARPRQRRSPSTRSPRAASSSWSVCSAAPRPGRCRSIPMKAATIEGSYTGNLGDCASCWSS